MSCLDTIYELSDTDSNCLFSVQSDQQVLEVREYKHLRWLRIDGHAIQSIIDIRSPDQVLNPVTKVMLAACYFENSNQILNLGFGGGAIERFFWKNFPKVHIASVESDEAIIHIARNYFSIPESAPIYFSNAEEFLLDTESQYNLIFCDIFIQESHPDCLYTSEFYRSVKNNLAPKGIFIINLIPSNNEDLLEVLLPLRKSFSYTYLYELEDHFNIIVFATNTPLQNNHLDNSMTSTTKSAIGVSPINILDTLKLLPVNDLKTPIR